MRLAQEIKNNKDDIQIGDILIFSDTKALLMMRTTHNYFAIDILNDGNKELGYIDYSDSEWSHLIDKIFNDFGNPLKVINMKNVTLSIE